MADYSMANRKIAYTLGRGRAYISDMSSTSGYMGAKYAQEFGPSFLGMSSCQKGSHLQRGLDLCCRTGLHREVIIMESRVLVDILQNLEAV